MTTATAKQLAALEKGNYVRLGNAKWKNEIASKNRSEGLAIVAALLRDAQGLEGPLGAMRAAYTLGAIHRIGNTSIGQLLSRAGITNGQRPLRELSERQREALANLLVPGDKPEDEPVLVEVEPEWRAPIARKPKRKPKKTVPVAPFRKRFLKLQEQEGLTAAELAERLGWKINSRNKPCNDGDRALRALGIKATYNGHGARPMVRERVKYETAVELADALGLDYWEVGV